jgi:hypothetical protein
MSASPNTIAARIELPKPVMVTEGNPNEQKRNFRMMKKFTKGNTRGKRNGLNRIKFAQEESVEGGGVPPSTTN